MIHIMSYRPATNLHHHCKANFYPGASTHHQLLRPPPPHAPLAETLVVTVHAVRGLAALLNGLEPGGLHQLPELTDLVHVRNTQRMRDEDARGRRRCQPCCDRTG